MIDRIGAETNFGNRSYTINAKYDDLQTAFAEIIADKIVSSDKPVTVTVARPGAHGYVGDGQILIPPELVGVPEDMFNDIVDLLSSLNDSAESIWDIILRLEDKVDIEALSESIDTDFDNSAGVGFIAALLTRFWKKKELSGSDVPEYGSDISTYYDQNHIENQVASELEALILKNKERKHFAAV